jgi:hypothetical protein
MITPDSGPPADMVATVNLSEAWRRAVGDELIRAECQFPDGRRATWGVMDRDGRLAFYQLDGTGAKRATEIEVRGLGSELSIIFHPFRPFRPGASRLLPGRQKDLPTAVIACPFGCQDPNRPLSLLPRRTIAQIPCQGLTWHAYANAAPFDPEGHFIWVPGLSSGVNSVLPHLEQRLTPPALTDFLFLSRTVANSLLFFNAPHAGATANHLHFQSVTHRGALAIEAATRRADAAVPILDYPAASLVFDDAAASQLWPIVDHLQQAAIPFNLIGIGQRAYLIPRDSNHEVVDEFPGGVLASMELAGCAITGDRAVYDAMTGDAFCRALHKTTLPWAAVLDLIRNM